MRMFRQFAGMIGHLHRQPRVGVRIKIRGGPDFLRGKSAGAATLAADTPPFYRCLSAQTEYITAIERRRNGGSLNGGRRVKPLSWRASSRLSSSSSSKKSLQSCSTSVWGADYRRYGAIFICLYGYRFSGIVLTRCFAVFPARFYFHVTVYIRASSNGFTFKQFFVAHDRCAMKVGRMAFCWAHGHRWLG